MNARASTVIRTGIGLEAPHAELLDRVARLATSEGTHPSGIEGLAIMRSDGPTPITPAVYEPSLCVVVQGRKEATLGEDVFTYDPLHFLVVSMALPVFGRVIEASPERPYLCLRIALDPRLIGELLLQLGRDRTARHSGGRAMMLTRTDAPLLDAVLRLVRLRDAPDEVDILGPLVLREIHYRVLVGQLGPRLMALCDADGHAQRIAAAIAMIRARFAEHLPIDDVAAAAHMSVSSFHHRFKAVTALSPLQFQKRLRLQEARRLMLMDGLDAAAAGYRVGYESPSQFSREYRRLYGAPPREEIQRHVAAARG